MMGLMDWGCKRRDLRVETFSPPAPIVQGVGFPSEPFNWLGANLARALSGARHAELSGGWLGSDVEEGRGKRRNAPGRRMLPWNRGYPNRTSINRVISD
jgi:hypothetical protein